MKYLYLLFLLPLPALADNPPPAGYSPNAPCLSNPCQSPDWIYYYPDANGIAQQTPEVWFRMADPPSAPALDPPGTGNHPGVGAPEISGSGAVAGLTLAVGLLLIARGRTLKVNHPEQTQ